MQAEERWTARTALLLGEEGVSLLSRKAVAVFGLGGVGSWAAEALARAGIGRLVLVDGDTVDVTNLNRQLVALRSTLGRSKAEVMAGRVRDICPECEVRAETLFYRPAAPGGTEGEGAGLICGCDYVADCIDMVSSKLALREECVQESIPLISAMGCGNRLDPSRFRVKDIFDTEGCGLCRVMRRELRRRHLPGMKVVCSDEPALTSTPEPASAPGTRPVPGSVSFVPAAAGLLLAAEIVKDLLAAGEIQPETGG
ncbi:MAG: tRNA threonylcarbamoyladenosine dehydratase [Clostridiales bacterium]|nr:tRNA threonylcarbamoyladenosine dehydratase [Clostridiales bacterium]